MAPGIKADFRDWPPGNSDSDEPMLSGKYPRLTACPSHRAPRDIRYLISKATKAKKCGAQPKSLEKYRKTHRWSSPSHDPSQRSQAIWPSLSLPIRPKLQVSNKQVKGTELSEVLKPIELSLRPKPWSDKFRPI